MLAMQRTATVGQWKAVRMAPARVGVSARMVVRAQATPSPAPSRQLQQRDTPLSTVDIESRRALMEMDMNWFRVPIKVYFKGGCLEVALHELVGKKRAFIITDKFMLDQEYVERVVDILDQLNIQHQVFYHVSQEPTESTVSSGLRELNDFKPDVIIALGGGSPMDAAKTMWYLYEQPNMTLQQLIDDANSGRLLVGQVTQMGAKALCICIATTSGTGSEVTPFAVVKEEKTGRKITLASYALTPSMAVLDPQLVMNLPQAQTAYGGQLTLAHAFESYISVFASDYSRGLSKHAMTMMTRYYERAYRKGNMDYHAREKMHNAATVAGMACANTYLGACHSLATEISSVCGCHVGLASGVLLPHVLRFMARDKVTKSALGGLAPHLKLATGTVDEQFENVMKWLDGMRKVAEIPNNLQDALGYMGYNAVQSKKDEICANALDDAHVVASPVEVSMDDLKKILDAACAK